MTNNSKPIIRGPGQQRGFKRWWIRHGGAYGHLADLNGKELAKTLGMFWLLGLVGGVFIWRFAPDAALIPWAAAGIGMLVVTVTAARWWFRYRYSGRQHRHVLFSRAGVIANGSEIAANASAKELIARSGDMRSQFSARADLSRGYALAPQLLPDQVREGLEFITAHQAERGKTVTAKDESLTCARLAEKWERVAVPAATIGGQS
ncbi:MAG: hypothetical protein FWD83_00285 [Promicromonosporaceae bacterium]|nr:hypothetical protein [Promicromonosporaceae bacterium]